MVYFIGTIYVVFSWKMWFYGGSFGCRAMIDTLPLLALPTAALLEIIDERSRALSALSKVFITVFIAFNLFQTWQYVGGILHWADMTKDYYKSVFFQTSSPTPEQIKLLKSDW